MHAELPWSSLLFRLRAHVPSLDALQKGPRQLPFSGVALAVDRAQVEELVAQRIPLFLLGKNALQRQRQLAQPRSLRPAAAFALIDRKSTRLNSSHANISYAVFC